MPDSIGDVARRVRANIERVIVGKGRTIDLLLVAMLSEGHVLLEDVPGIGKTMLARSVARSLGCTFRRVQCTPDLLPSDITGTYIYNQKTSDFEFRAGPLFAQLVLADEINRATPRAQSALLEAMGEGQVTAEGETKLLPKPFLVIATQNPVEMEGTFPLPEAQLDRFMLRIRLGYPTQEEDVTILDRFARRDPLSELQPVVSADEVLRLQKAVREIALTPDVRGYIIQLVHATRAHASVELGASPRAMLGLYRCAQALAAIRGRAYVIPDDVKELAPYTLEHRVMLKAQSSLRGQTSAETLKQIIDSVPVPVEERATAPVR